MNTVKVTTTATIVKMGERQQSQRMTSLEIAKLTGKEHNHVMRDIRKMEAAWQKVTQSKFGLSTYKDSTGRTLPCYSLTKTECLYIATKFNDEARARLVLRWEQLEVSDVRSKMSDVKYLPSPAEIMNEAENIVARQLDVANAESQDCVTTTQIAQMYNMEVGDMISFLRDCEILKPRGRQRLTPEYEDMGLAEMRHCLYYSLKGELKESIYMVWTPKGRQLIQDIMRNAYFY